ncbi:MAG: hypothetical protein AUJ02_04085 [Chloroflexi bacterium 13_1_40CM_3_65_12]|nr:MAG: hypothetical protein AUH69_12650 [Actinobacteria bacterium 13_1_40CM_4_65_12]OLD25883.1 MAG: hypothetical protein AUJ02_04085 [Chloroflexi bacterium 13_1_40CM_3_65_12]OLD49175.1 MAG: hypothetical protein AUI42_09110 [Actinobacteria bacterium 13_1_40CM_2_65_8]
MHQARHQSAPGSGHHENERSEGDQHDQYQKHIQGDKCSRAEIDPATERQRRNDQQAAHVDDKMWGLGAWTKEMLPPVPQSAGDAQSVGKGKHFDCCRLAEIATRTDCHAGSLSCRWLRCYYQPVVIQDQAGD